MDGWIDGRKVVGLHETTVNIMWSIMIDTSPIGPITSSTRQQSCVVMPTALTIYNITNSSMFTTNRPNKRKNIVDKFWM